MSALSHALVDTLILPARRRTRQWRKPKFFALPKRRQLRIAGGHRTLTLVLPCYQYRATRRAQTEIVAERYTTVGQREIKSHSHLSETATVPHRPEIPKQQCKQLLKCFASTKHQEHTRGTLLGTLRDPSWDHPAGASLAPPPPEAPRDMLAVDQNHLVPETHLSPKLNFLSRNFSAPGRALLNPKTHNHIHGA